MTEGIPESIIPPAAARFIWACASGTCTSPWYFTSQSHLTLFEFLLAVVHVSFLFAAINLPLGGDGLPWRLRPQAEQAVGGGIVLIP